MPPGSGCSAKPVQEAKAEFPQRERYPDIELHLIGPLQTNKVKEAVALFDVIQTVGPAQAGVALAEEMAKQGKHPRCFVEVNTGAEPRRPGYCRRMSAIS